MTRICDQFIKYRRKHIAELRPYVPGEALHGVSVSEVDLDAGSPKSGDMIARNPKNHADQWLVAAAYFADNFEPAIASFEGDAVERVARIIDPNAGWGVKLDSDYVDLRHEQARLEGKQRIAITKADAILASGLVPDEAAIRADEREKCAAWHDDQSRIEMDSLHCGDNTSTIAAARRRADWHDKAAAAIRSGDGE